MVVPLFPTILHSNDIFCHVPYILYKITTVNTVLDLRTVYPYLLYESSPFYIACIFCS